MSRSDIRIFISGAFLLFVLILLNCSVTYGQQVSYIDNDFNPSDLGLGDGVNGDIRSVVRLSNGKIIIAGAFVWYNGTSKRNIARLNSDGSLDNSFSAGTAVNNRIWAMAIQSDGKIIIGGSFTSFNNTSRNYIARLNADGTPDATFDTGVGPDSEVKSLSIQTDDKIIIGGAFTTYNGTSRNNIARLNANGSLDLAFNSGFNAYSGEVNAIALQSDGKIIIGGNFSSYSSASRNNVARLNSNGNIDTGFNPGTGADNTVYSLAIQSDNKIIIGGSFTTYNNVSRNRIARIETNGSLDTSFDPGTGASSNVYSTAIQTDGKVIIGGAFTSFNGTTRNYITRLTSTGSLDSSFDPGTGANNWIYTVLIQPDNSVILGGGFTTLNGKVRNRITRLASSGSLDMTFNPFTGVNGSVRAIAIQSDGKIIIAGEFTSYNDVAINRIARLNTDGSLDVSFNPGLGPTGGAGSQISTIIIDKNNKIIIGGRFTSYNGTSIINVARLNTDGSLDTGFNPCTQWDFWGNTSVNSIAIDATDKLIIGGTFIVCNGSSNIGLARLNSDGSLDAGFNLGNAGVNKISLLSGGKIIVAGWFTPYTGTSSNTIARLDANGSVDVSFNPGTGPNNNPTTMMVQADGKIIIGGNFTTYNGVARNYIARLNSDGTLDTGFDPGTGANMDLTTIALQDDEKIIIGGNFTTFNGIVRKYIARLNTNGSLDTGFDPGTGVNNTVQVINVQTDDLILVGGDFTTMDGTRKNRLARILPMPVTLLPVELTYFKVQKASLQPAVAKLIWQTAMERNNAYFEIERSSDGIEFKTIGKVAGAGDSYAVTNYSFKDEAPVINTTNYYRLRQVDLDGSFSYSAIQAISFKDSQQINIYPNPATNEVNVSGLSENNQNQQFFLTDIRGTKLETEPILENGKATFDLKDLPSGLYFLKVIDSLTQASIVYKLVKL